MENFSNKAAAIIDLQNRGYDQDFIIASENIYCIQRGDSLPPDGFEITETYRFDKQSRTVDKDVIYAIRSLNDDLRGILMTSYSSFSKGMSIHLWSKLAASLNLTPLLA
ncbi:MAG TPA: hypothetical protein VGM63_05940 [Mucilaginibacter sp.]|jgi:hypothetical protein